MEALGRASGEAAAAPGPRERGALVLVGFMGAGKSTTARMLAAELGVESIDSDRELERELGEPIDSFYDRQGEQAFRAREEEVVLRLLSDDHERVVALGGGSLGSERVREALGRHLVVHLEVEPDEAWRRASNRARPLARDRGRFEQLHRERLAVYESMADASLPAADRNLPRRALDALRALRSAPQGTRLVWASAASAEYPVFFGHGLVAEGFFYPAGPRRFVVTDPNVAAHHSLQGEATVEIPPGESEKTLARAEQVLQELARAGATRADLVVAVGGGVVGDLAGFCAAVYQRGMRHVQVPTTLVAQVDSAFGGKTGVDLPEGKNYAGAYHQPSAVIVDPEVLATLPREEAAAGYVEVVKTALIAGGRLWAHVRAGGDPDDEAILGCLRTKLRHRRPGRARRRPAAGAEPGPHGGPRDRGRHRLLPLPARRGGRSRPARLPAAVGPRDAACRGGRAARRPRAARTLRGRERGRGRGVDRTRQEARGGAGALRVAGGAGRGHAGPRRGRGGVARGA